MALQVGVGPRLVAIEPAIPVAIQLAKQLGHALLKLLQLIGGLNRLQRGSRQKQHKSRHQSDQGRLQGQWAQTMQPESTDHVRIPGKL